ncbi:MAG: N-acetylneuraminate synthase family protein [Crocinitomicaceae bacterium]
MIYNIIEVANTHGGDFEYLKRLINEFTDLKGGYGVKFQPLAAHTIATSDYEWYGVYEELRFSESQWKEIIDLTRQSKDVWIDIFDGYGVEIFAQNRDKVEGIKFQTSVLQNTEVLNLLSKYDFSKIKVILNIAARSIEEIKAIISNIQGKLNPQEIILELGFQSYPTSFEDCGISKIAILRKEFDNRLVFADHIDGKTDDAIWLPVIASMMGVDIVEKHVMLDEPTKYDHFSSLTPDRYKLMAESIAKYSELPDKDFINDRERTYLEKSLMFPILNREIKAGNLVSLENDFIFRRTNKKGLTVNQIKKAIENFNVIVAEKAIGDVLYQNDFKKANIATIIACRLKSSRLPKKALLPIGKLSSVEFCIANAMKFENVQHTILATSTAEQDQELKGYTYSPSVVFHTGSEDDVIQRYIDVCDKMRIDVVIRVTADMPFIDNEICQILLKSHFESGADYTTGTKAAVGTNLEIINVAALRKVKEHFKNAEYSEYMTWYFQNNPTHFRLNFVELPDDLVRDYRLTLDYQEDLDMFNNIDSHFNGDQYGIRDIFEYLDNNAEVAKINSHITLKYKTDEALIKTLNDKTKIR